MQLDMEIVAEESGETKYLANATSSEEREPVNPPPIEQSAWIVVAGCFLAITSTYGILSSVGVIQVYWESHQLSNYSSASISWIVGTNLFLNLLVGVQIGPLLDQYGPFWLLLVGSILYVLSFILMAQSEQYWQFMLTFGVIASVSGASISIVGFSVPAQWFEKRIGLAMGIISMGSSVGGISMPFVLGVALRKLSWAWTMRLLALASFVLLLLANIFISGRTRQAKPWKIIEMHWFCKPSFVWTALGTAMFEFVLFNSLALLPDYALDLGFGTSHANNAVAILNSGSAIGRLLSGWASDKLGGFNVMLCTLTWSTTVMFALWTTVGHSVIRLYVATAMFGLGSGSVISLAPVCVGRLCNAQHFGGCFGTCYSFVSVVVLISIPTGGLMISNIGSQSYSICMGSILAGASICFLAGRSTLVTASQGWRI